MSALLYLAGAAGVAGIWFATEGVPSSALAKSWANDVPDFFCKVVKLIIIVFCWI